MNKKIQFFSLMFIISSVSFAQVGIGTTSPDASAALDITATDKGFLMPRMTTAQRTAIVSPAMGLQVYDTETKSVWNYNDTSWVEAGGGTGKFVDGASSNIAYYNGSVGIGRDNFSTGAHKLYVESIKDTDGANTATRINATYEGTGTNVSTYALAAFAKNSSSATIDYAIGTVSFAENSNVGGTLNNAMSSYSELVNIGTVAEGAGVWSELNNSGTLNYGAGFRSVVRNDGTIGEVNGLVFQYLGTGTVANSYAIYIDGSFNKGTSENFSIYSLSDADSYFNGNIGIGTTSPQQKVHINGVMRLEAQATAPSGALGDLYVGTDNKLYFHNGTAWKEVQLVP
ncbi:MAG: hypothetical protein L3J08_00600 [Flavobacteriaceae bacterium]|nr:hypothetical protein [Flavobacteriaceae bacterium]